MKHNLRILAAVLLILVFATTGWAFTDTGDLAAEELTAIEALSALGVVEGYADGSFRPAALVTRAEFAKMLCVYAGQDELRETAGTFGDVAPAAWYYGWVGRAAEQGWLTGYPDGGYRPQNLVTQQELAAVLVRVSGMDTTGFAWPDEYIFWARELGIPADGQFTGEAPASRLTACQMFYNLLKAQGEEDTQPEPETAADDEGAAATLKDGLYLGVVESVQERQLKLWQTENTLPLAERMRSTPLAGTLISYNIKDGVVDDWKLLLNAAGDSIASISHLTRVAVKNGPYAWVATRSAETVDNPAELNSIKPLARYVSYRNIAVGPSSLTNRNYFMEDDCQIYEIREKQVSPGDRDSIAVGQAVTMLVDANDNVLFLFCWL